MIIVGAGIIGASFAYHAYKKGVNQITVLSSDLPGDKNQATTNTWGWANGYASNDKSYASFRQANLNYWPKLINDISNLEHSSKGAFIWDLNEIELHQTIKQHQSWGQSVKILTKSELQGHLPNLINSPTLAGFGTDDLAIEGVKVTQELLKVSESKIIKVNVKELVCEGNKVTGVKTDDEVINDNEVVITAGMGTPELLSTIDIHFEMRSSLGLLAYTNPLPSLLNYPITGFDFHARQDDKGRLIIGGKFDDDASNEQNIMETAKKLVQDMATRLNYNGKMILDYFTIGSRPLPIDGRPKIGRLVNCKGQKINGIYLAVMHSGITNAPLAGKLGIDEIITGKRNNLIQDFIPQVLNKLENLQDV